MSALPYATPQGSRGLVRGERPQALVATAWLALASAACVLGAGLAPGRLAAMIAVVAGVTVASGARYKARAGGITGDFLGATEQLGEIAALAVLAWTPLSGT
jgi:adenosylcobinamide-GDP ribazoletransferase